MNFSLFTCFFSLSIFFSSGSPQREPEAVVNAYRSRSWGYYASRLSGNKYINVHNGRDNSACKSYGWVMLEVFFGELVGDEISGKGKLARVFSLVEIDSWSRVLWTVARTSRNVFIKLNDIERWNMNKNERRWVKRARNDEDGGTGIVSSVSSFFVRR